MSLSLKRKLIAQPNVMVPIKILTLSSLLLEEIDKLKEEDRGKELSSTLTELIEKLESITGLGYTLPFASSSTLLQDLEKKFDYIIQKEVPKYVDVV